MVLAQRLINAREAECARVARELHDNIGGSLALFSMELEKTRLALSDMSSDNDARFGRLCARVKDLGREIGNLSHQLHSSELELLGLGVAIKRLCREFSEQYQVQVHCECSAIPGNLSAEVSLCLFRVTQEAFQNIGKHSRATEIDVHVRGDSKFLSLCISDNGIGFAPHTRATQVGLGLISMRERLHLIGGKLTIISKSGSGTRVEANTPMTKTSTKSECRPQYQPQEFLFATRANS